MSRTVRILSAVLGAALLVGAPSAWYLSQPPDQVGDVEVLGTPQAEPVVGSAGEAGDGEVAGTADEVPSDDGALTFPEDPDEWEDGREDATATRRASGLSGPVMARPVPTGLRIPSLGVDAPVVPVSLEDDGSMEIPDDVELVGWYAPGVRPGQNGTAVLSGHVDSGTQGPGVLYDLRRMDLDDVIVTTGDDGEPQEWRVVARTRYGKAELPVSEIFVRTGPPRLAVITCGGEFDAVTRSYSDNVVVLAEPA